MNEALQSLLARYSPASAADYENALKEIIQEIILLGLWRAKFFEHAAFYGGSCLRILYGLDRFLEDLDFSLLKPRQDFALERYYSAVKIELKAFGLEAEVIALEKKLPSAVQSAFVKLGTRQHLIQIGVPERLSRRIQRSQVLKVKFEVDTTPPGSFAVYPMPLLRPIPFAVNSYTLPNLFAGKLHAIICRGWEEWVKGRDWYDLIWLLARDCSVNLAHLRARLVQSGHWAETEPFTATAALRLLSERIEKTDFAAARRDVIPFLRTPAAVEIWSTDFFCSVIQRLKFENADSA